MIVSDATLMASNNFVSSPNSESSFTAIENSEAMAVRGKTVFTVEEKLINAVDFAPSPKDFGQLLKDLNEEDAPPIF